MINVVKRILSHSAVNPERVLLDWVSAAEAVRFADVVTTFTAKIRELGPLSADAQQNAEAQQLKLEAALNASNGEKLRWVAAKQTEFMKDGNRYGEVFTAHETGRFLDGVIIEEMIIQQILLLLQREALSVMDIAKKLAVAPQTIFTYMMSLARKKMVEIAQIRDRDPLYTLSKQAA
jgi:F420-non-reducing hydrogenase iron-sulfur subunit